MLGFFPDPYPDEVFHGTLCRLYKILGKPSGHTFSRLLFGEVTTGTGVIFPKKLEELMAHMPPNHNLTKEKIMESHTLVPIYAAFAKSEKQKGLEPIYLYSCPTCRKEDVTQFGEAYWHRSHQVPNLKTCHKHQTPLEQASTPYRHARNNTRNYFLPEESKWIPIETTNQELEIHNRFNTRVQAILTGTKLGTNYLVTLQAACQRANLTKGTGLWTERMLTILQKKLGSSLYDLYCYKPDQHASKELLAKVLRGKETNPYRHLLFYEVFNLKIGQQIPLLPKKEKPPRVKLGWNPPFKRMAQNKERYRAAYLALIKAHPKTSRSHIEKMDVHAARWLRKYDKVWLAGHTSKMEIAHRKNYTTPEERDKTNLKLIKQALELVKLDTGVPKRITAGYLESLLPGKTQRISRNAHLPQCKVLLDSHQEEDVTFYKRRIDWAITKIEGRILYRPFCKLAAIRPKVDQNPEIDQIAREAHRKNQEICQGK